MSEIESKILSLLDSGHKIDDIVDRLKMDKEDLADIIVDLDINGFVHLKDKSWVLTQEGHNVLNKIKESLRNLKLDYLDGNIGKDEFLEKRKNLEYVILSERPKQDDSMTKGRNITCSKCGVDNNAGSRYCYKCGLPLSV